MRKRWCLFLIILFIFSKLLYPLHFIVMRHKLLNPCSNVSCLTDGAAKLNADDGFNASIIGMIIPVLLILLIIFLVMWALYRRRKREQEKYDGPAVM